MGAISVYAAPGAALGHDIQAGGRAVTKEQTHEGMGRFRSAAMCLSSAPTELARIAVVLKPVQNLVLGKADPGDKPCPRHFNTFTSDDAVKRLIVEFI